MSSLNRRRVPFVCVRNLERIFVCLSFFHDVVNAWNPQKNELVVVCDPVVSYFSARRCKQPPLPPKVRTTVFKKAC